MRRSHSGFGLLEAIVALTLIASTGLALFSWVNTNLAEASRLRDRDAAAQLKVVAVELMASVNPMATPTGQWRQQPIVLSWNATATGSALPSMGPTGTPTRIFELQLFDTVVDAQDEKSGAKVRFNLTLLGYRRSDRASPAT